MAHARRNAAADGRTRISTQLSSAIGPEIFARELGGRDAPNQPGPRLPGRGTLVHVRVPDLWMSTAPITTLSSAQSCSMSSEVRDEVGDDDRCIDTTADAPPYFAP